MPPARMMPFTDHPLRRLALAKACIDPSCKSIDFSYKTNNSSYEDGECRGAKEVR